MTRLSLTLAASPLETPTSYLSRLAARSFATDIWDFAGDLGLDFAELTNGTAESVRHLCACAGLPEDSFARTNVLKISTMKYRVGDEVMNTEVLDRGGIRFCPRCVVEAQQRGVRPWEVIHEARWQIIQIRRCPRHGVRLRRHKPEMDPFSRFDFTRFLAEGRLELSDTPSGGMADALDLYLAARVHGMHEPNWCDRMQLPALIKAVEAFGVLLNHGREAVTSRLSAELRRDAMLTGFEVLSRGEEGIMESLRDFTAAASAASSSRQDHVWARYGALQRLLGSHSKMREDLQPLRDIVRAFFLANFPFKVGTLVLGEKVTEVRILSLRSACRTVGARQSLVEEMLIAQGHAERDASGRVCLLSLLTAEIVAGLCREKSAWLNQPETADYLGCSFGMFKQLARSGLLVPAEGKKRRARKGFHKRDLDAFLEKIFAGAPRLDAPPPGCATLELATRKGKCSAPDIVRMILDGTLRPVGRETDRLELRGLLVDADAIIAMWYAQEPNGYPAMWASRKLRMTHKTVNLLVAEGLLEKRMMKNTRSWYTNPLVTVESCLAFDADYCTLGQLRVEVVCTPQLRHAHLRKAGIEPVIEGQGLTSVYRREDLRAAGFL